MHTHESGWGSLGHTEPLVSGCGVTSGKEPGTQYFASFPKHPCSPDTGQVYPEMAEVPEEYTACPGEGAHLGGQGSWGGTEPPRFPAAGPGGTDIQGPGDCAALGPLGQRRPREAGFRRRRGPGFARQRGAPRAAAGPSQGKGLGQSRTAGAEVLGSLVVCLCPKNISASSLTVCPPLNRS